VADGPSLPARVLQNPRVGFGVTTVALVALASTGTGLLVAHGTKQLQPPPVISLPTPAVEAGPPVLVPRAPGTLRPPVARPVVAPRVVVPAAQPLPVLEPVPAPTPDVTPVVEPPVVEPPVVPPPVVEPPVVPPPVVEPPVVSPDVKGHGKKAHPAHPEDNGKHLGQKKH
jgi:hypothetical protein